MSIDAVIVIGCFRGVIVIGCVRGVSFVVVYFKSFSFSVKNKEFRIT